MLFYVKRSDFMATVATVFNIDNPSEEDCIYIEYKKGNVLVSCVKKPDGFKPATEEVPFEGNSNQIATNANKEIIRKVSKDYVLPAEVVDKKGPILVDAGILYCILRKLPYPLIKVNVDRNNHVEIQNYGDCFGAGFKNLWEN